MEKQALYNEATALRHLIRDAQKDLDNAYRYNNSRCYITKLEEMISNLLASYTVLVFALTRPDVSKAGEYELISEIELN